MDIDDYCLSDLPKQEIIRRSHTNLTQLPQQISLNNDFVKTLNRQEIITTKFECLFTLYFDLKRKKIRIFFLLF